MVKYNKEESLKKDSEIHKAQIISFYAYKGGIGKTTALIKTALLLADKGKKIAIIDMDLEEPGFYDAFSSTLKLEGGLVNYLFNKYNGTAKGTTLEKMPLVKSLKFRSGGAIYVIPAGRVDSDYIKMIKSLKEKRIDGNRDIQEIIDKISKAYNIDYVLIDSRHGINFWGGLSLSKVADEVMMFAYPDMENIQGINLFLETIEDKEKCSLVISKVNSSERATQEVENILKKVNFKDNIMKIGYDSEMAEKAKYPIENKIKKYSEICDTLLENEVKRKNKEWINNNASDVIEFIENLAEGNNFNKILTDQELKILNIDNYALAIDDSINIKNLIEGYYDDKKVINLTFHNKLMKKIVEKYCNAEGFLDICCLSMFSLALVSLDENLNINQNSDIEKALSKYFMDFYYKSNNSKGRILNASNYFVEILNAKKSESEGKEEEKEEGKVVCINIDRLMEFISMLEASCNVAKAKNAVLFRVLFLILNVLNRNNNYQFKLILNDRKYRNDEDFNREFKNNILELTWNNSNRRQDIIDKIRNVNTKLFKQEMYSKVKRELIFPMSVQENGVKFKFDEWFVNALDRQRLLNKKGILDVIKESAALEKNNENSKSSIITINKIKIAIQRCVFR
ncbi:MAG: hypothetical protein E7213_07555 [Clostridium sp.]|nr:hypothetical protein [Clostridium sp.]